MWLNGDVGVRRLRWDASTGTDQSLVDTPPPEGGGTIATTEVKLACSVAVGDIIYIYAGTEDASERHGRSNRGAFTPCTVPRSRSQATISWCPQRRTPSPPRTRSIGEAWTNVVRSFRSPAACPNGSRASSIPCCEWPGGRQLEGQPLCMYQPIPAAPAGPKALRLQAAS